MGRLHRILAGTDGPGRRALPAGEFLHPVPLAAVALLAINDHVLKGGGWLPGAVTGKLSDAAGFVFFPLLLTAALDCAAYAAARLGAPVDFSLRRWKLYAGLAITAALMAAIKLSAAGASGMAALLGDLGFTSFIVVDPTDLLTAPALLVPWWIGRRELARVPLGRLEVLERAYRRSQTPPLEGLRDLPPTAANRLATALEHYYRTGDPMSANAALDELRD